MVIYVSVGENQFTFILCIGRGHENARTFLAFAHFLFQIYRYVLVSFLAIVSADCFLLVVKDSHKSMTADLLINCLVFVLDTVLRVSRLQSLLSLASSCLPKAACDYQSRISMVPLEDQESELQALIGLSLLMCFGRGEQLDSLL